MTTIQTPDCAHADLLRVFRCYTPDDSRVVEVCTPANQPRELAENDALEIAGEYLDIFHFEVLCRYWCTRMKPTAGVGK